MTKRLFWILAALWCAGCAPALKDLSPGLSATDSGTVWFASAGSLVRSADSSRLVMGEPVVISGELEFPPGPGPFPAVVLAHGCGGIGNAETGWAPLLREWGYATFVLDSFRGRGLTSVCASARLLTGTQRIPDAYGALRTLATHPRIDAARIALMGFSHGGSLTLGASTEWARQAFAPAQAPAFRAFLAFYPLCTTDYPERQRISAPLRIHSGELDDWTPARPCAALVEQLVAAGQDAAISIYPGAHHSFDNIGRSLRYLPNVGNGAHCAFRIGSILGPFPSAREFATCFRRGATIAWSTEATAQARREVRAQLSALLR